MRTILFSVINNLIPPLALLVPIGRVPAWASTAIRPTTTEILAFMAGVFIAVAFAIALFAVNPTAPISGGSL